MSSPSEGGDAPVRVVIADDNAVIRMGLRLLLEAEPTIELVGEATDGAKALALAYETKPDVVLLDVRMPGTGGLEVLAELSAFTCVLMLTSSDEDETIWSAMQAGARGYLVYGTFDETGIVQNIRAAAGGGSVLSPPAARALLKGLGTPDPPPAVAPSSEAGPGPQAPAVPNSDLLGSSPELAALLSDREIGVMDLLAAGRTNTEIAETLFLAPKTVKNHINRIFAKLHVTSRAQAIAVWLGTAGGPAAHPAAQPELGPGMGPGALGWARRRS
jgi:DNA-binding NarL/FixJ family response regulator